RMAGPGCVFESPERIEKRVQNGGEQKKTKFPEDRMEERILIERLQQGDPGAIDELIDRYKNQVFAFIVRMVGDYTAAEDIFQETWIKVIRSINRFRGESKLSTWLFQIALNQARDVMRKKGRHVYVPLDEIENLAGKPDIDVEQMASADQVRKMVAELPDKMREVIILKYFHDLSDIEIANVTGCPEGTVKSRLHRASKILRKKWAYLESY
ncbi:MAG: sigma-70 family RNA polymerase sigma factor, partial [Candidatus Latescibacteria bacterium]|nr:sigma-70 family RNA polymerase sigma factor [Candidatus Latescibacterota bacterium]